MPRNTTKAVRKATTSKGIPTGTTISYGDIKVEHLLGPYVPILLYFRHYRHWCGPEHNGEPRPMDRQFLELEREGTDCLYRALNALVGESYPHGSDMRRPPTAPNPGRWGDMHREHAEVKRAWAANNGAEVKRAGPTPYGATYDRAHHQSVHDVMVPHVVTPDEAQRDGMPNAAGSTAWTCDPTQRTTATAEQVGHRWAEVYAEEVRHLLGDEPNDETLAAFAHLHANLKGYTIGTKEGARVMDRMKAEGMGAEVLAAFGRIRERLNALLDEVAEEHSAPEPIVNRTRITWLGTKGELAGLIMELHERGWIRKDGSWAALAAKVQAVFQDAEGQPFDLPTLRQYVKPSGNFTLREGVRFDVDERPE